MYQSILISLFHDIRQHGLELELPTFVSRLSAALDDASIYILNDSSELLAHTGLGEELLQNMEEQFSLELDLLTEGDDEHSHTIPLRSSGIRLGTLWAAKNSPFTENDTFLLKAAASLISLVLAQQSRLSQEKTDYQRKMALSAAASLTHSEMIITYHVIQHLKNECGNYPTLPEGLIIASHIADSAGMARSVIVNALRKLQSAEVIEARSLGMKGTWVRINNYEFMKEVENFSVPTTA